MEPWPWLFQVLSWTNPFCAGAVTGDEQPHPCHPEPCWGQSRVIQELLLQLWPAALFQGGLHSWAVLRAGHCAHLSPEIIVWGRSQAGVRALFLCQSSLFQRQHFLLLNIHYWAKILHLRIRPTVEPVHGPSTKQQLKCL